MLVSPDAPVCAHDISPSSFEPHPTPDDAALLEDIVAVVSRCTGIDFARYRRATVARRIRNRMISIGAESLHAYRERLRGDEREAWHLLERLTITVSRFYRNRRTFDALAQAVIPALVLARGERPVRIWSAGCGCGEEAYTLAMLLEAAGAAGTVDATDIDPAALLAAETGSYRAEAFEELPPPLAQAYLQEAGGSRYRVADAPRRRVRFFQHDLTGVFPPAEAPYDLVCCRNLLIYLDREAQRHAFAMLCSMMAPDGYLCIGEAEWPPPEIGSHLMSCGHKTQVFRRIER